MKSNNFLRNLGPGIIVAALVFGPSKITITSKLGAGYGFDLLWIIIIAIFFMAVFTTMAARVGLSTDKSLLSTISEKWGRTISIIVGVGIFLVCTSFQAGNSVGAGIALGELTRTNKEIWIILINLIGVALLFFRSFYKVLEKLMIFLISLMLFAFLITIIMIKPDLSGVIGGFIPSVPNGSTGLIIAFIASCFSIVGAFYTTYLVQERKRISKFPHEYKDNSLTGILLLGILSAIVMIVAGSVLFPQGIQLTTATDMSMALKPAFGNYAAVLFLIGLFAASFSSIVGNASIGGTLFGDALGAGSDFSSPKTRLFISIVMIAGAAIAILFGQLPLELIVLAQSITIFIVPIIGIAMYLIANDKNLMGNNRNSMFFRISGFLGLIVVIGLAVINFKNLFLN